MKEIVPRQTSKITKALRTMGYNTLHRVPVVPRQDCQINNCWINVPLVIEVEGGEIVPGRIVWIEQSEKWLHLEAHCCWKKPDGTIVDPTPKADREKVIAFVEEPLKWDGHFIIPRYHPFTDEPDVVNFLEWTQRYNTILSQLKQGESRQPTPAEREVDHQRKLAVSRLENRELTNNRGQHVGRNDPCPCGSGRKFKKCCGAVM